MTPKQRNAILALIGDPGWDALVARADQRITAWKKGLMDPSLVRKDKLPDDYLRGQIEALEWFTALPDTLEREDDLAKEEDVAQRRRRETGDLIARVGATFPGVGERPLEGR